MNRESIIKPDVIHILCRDPQPVRRVVYEPMPTPTSEPEPKKTIWEKLKGFFQGTRTFLKETITIVASAFAVVGGYMVAKAALTNASARHMDASRKASRAYKGA